MSSLLHECGCVSRIPLVSLHWSWLLELTFKKYVRVVNQAKHSHNTLL